MSTFKVVTDILPSAFPLSPITDDANIKALFYRKFFAMASGNLLEWYDFAIFGALTDILGEQFFPKTNSNMQFLQSLAVFGAAFFMRPLGVILEKSKSSKVHI